MIWTKGRVYKTIPVAILAILLVIISKVQSNNTDELLEANGVNECFQIFEISVSHPHQKLSCELWVEYEGYVKFNVNANIHEPFVVGDSITVQFLPSNYRVNKLVRKGC